MLKQSTLLILFFSFFAVPLNGNAHSFETELSGNAQYSLLPSWQGSVCVGSTAILEAPSGYDPSNHVFLWYKSDVDATAAYVGEIYVTSPITQNQTLLLVVVDDSDDTVAKRYYVITASPTYDILETVTVCDSYDWQGNQYVASGNYSIPYTSSLGCDSTQSLNLTVKQSSSASFSMIECDRYTWYGTTYTASATPVHTIANHVGCDSVMTLNLTINNHRYNEEIQTVCDAITWHGTQYTTSGDHIFDTAGAGICRDTVVLHLTVNGSTASTEVVSACDSYTWHGTNYTVSTTTPTHVFTRGNANGCDSTVTLNLTVRYSNSGSISETACDKYTWYGTTYTASATPVHTITNHVGCDSVITLDLTINNHRYNEETQTVCDAITWHGTQYTTSGDHIFDTAGTGVCRDTVVLHLTVNGSTASTEVVSACDSYTWHGTNYTISTTTPTHVFTRGNANGCDSTVTLNLTVRYSNSGSISETACDKYTWYGTTYTASATPVHTITNHVGCDSVIRLNLTINNHRYNEETQTVCDAITWHGTQYTTSGNYIYQTAGQGVCIDTTVLHLTVKHSSSWTETVSACDSLRWHGTKYTSSTTTPTHVFVHGNSVGCDSTVTLHLTVYSTKHKTETRNACDSYVWPRNSRNYTSSNNTDWIYGGKDNHQCDSVIHLNLTLNHSVHTDTVATVCDDIFWRGQHRITSGDYIYTKNGQGVCHDTIVLHLTVNKSTAGTENVSGCDSALWHGTMYYNSTNTPTFLMANGNSRGCDSTATLALTLYHGQHQTFSVESCDSYEWTSTNSTYNTSGTYLHNYQSADNCASVDTLNLTIHYSSHNSVTEDECDSYLWSVDGLVHKQSGDYVFKTTDSYGCDIVDTLHLTIRYGTFRTITETVCESYVWEQGSRTFTESTDEVLTYVNDVNCFSADTLHLTVYGQHVPEVRSLVEKKHKNSSDPWVLIYPRMSGEQDYYYQWYRNEDPVVGANQQYYQLPDELAGSMVVYSVRVSNKELSECASVSRDTINFIGTKELELTSYPNPAQGQFRVSFKSDSVQPKVLDIYSESGKLVVTIPMSGKEVLIDEKLPAGVYLLRLTAEDGSTVVGKTIVK